MSWTVNCLRVMSVMILVMASVVFPMDPEKPCMLPYRKSHVIPKEKPHMPSFEELYKQQQKQKYLDDQLEKAVERALPEWKVGIINYRRSLDDQSVQYYVNHSKYLKKRSFKQLGPDDQSPDHVEQHTEETEFSEHVMKMRQEECNSIVKDHERCPCCRSCLGFFGEVIFTFCKNLGF